MRSFILVILALPLQLLAQTNNVTATKIRASESIRVGTTASQKIEGFDIAIPGVPTNIKLPTTKAVVDWVTGNVVMIGGTALGDLGGTYPSPTVDGLQGRPISATPPIMGQVLEWSGSQWVPSTDDTGAGGIINTDATLSGDGSGGSPLKIAQQSAATSEIMTWTGATWEPSWGNPYTFVTSGATITTAVNTVLIGTISANITIGLPTCNAANDQKTFEIKKNGADFFGAIIDPAGSETFYGGATSKTIYSPISINCTCRFSGTGVWFYTN